MYSPQLNGAKCGDCPLQGQLPTPPILVNHPKLIIIGDFPGAYDAKVGAPLSASAGKKLDSALAKLGIPKKECQINLAILCQPTKKLTPKEFKKAIACCHPRLVKEVNVEPGSPNKVIVALGQKALVTTLDKAQVFQWMGGPSYAEDFQAIVVPTIGPGMVLKSAEYGPVLAVHLERAWAIARNVLKPWKWPEIITCHTHKTEQLLEALAKLEKEEWLGVDIETSGLDYKSVIKDIGLTSRTLGVSIQPWLVTDIRVINALKRILRSKKIKKALQNGQFDKFCLDHSGYFLSGIDFDTLIAHQVLAPRWPHKLGFQGCIEFHAPRWKAEFKAEGEELWESDSKGLERAIYNVKDAYITLLLRDRYITRLANGPRTQEQFDTLMNELTIALKMRKRGVLVDADRLAFHKSTLGTRLDNALDEIKRLAKRFNIENFNPNPGSSDLNDLFHITLGIKPLAFSALTGKPKYDATELLRLSSHENLIARTFAILILEYRKVNKLKSTYVDNCPLDHDHSVRPTWYPGGAKTRRWSCGSPNLMNIPKMKVGNK